MEYKYWIEFVDREIASEYYCSKYMEMCSDIVKLTKEERQLMAKQHKLWVKGLKEDAKKMEKAEKASSSSSVN